MLPLLFDENFNEDILQGVSQRLPNLAIVTVQSAGLRGTPDDRLLELAARAGQILVTCDANTMPGFAWDRVREGLRMTGVLIVPPWLSTHQAIEELAVVAECGRPEDFENQVWHLPFRSLP